MKRNHGFFINLFSRTFNQEIGNFLISRIPCQDVMDFFLKKLSKFSCLAIKHFAAFLFKTSWIFKHFWKNHMCIFKNLFSTTWSQKIVNLSKNYLMSILFKDLCHQTDDFQVFCSRTLWNRGLWETSCRKSIFQKYS